MDDLPDPGVPEPGAWTPVQEIPELPFAEPPFYDPDALTIPLPELTDHAPTTDRRLVAPSRHAIASVLTRRISLPVWMVIGVALCLLAAVTLGESALLGAATQGAGPRHQTSFSTPSATARIGGAAARWPTVQTFAGYRDANTVPFTVNSAEWNLVWSCDPEKQGGDYDLTAQLIVPSDQDGQTVVNVTCAENNRATWQGQTAEYAPGTYYLAIQSDGPWTFAIQAP